MKTVGGYFKLSLKRCAKVFPFLMVVSLALAIAISMILSGMMKMAEADEKNQRFKIGLVGESDSMYLDFGVSALKTLDSSRYTVDIIEMTEEEAQKKINNSEISAYVVLTDEFIENAASGKLGKVKYVTTAGSVDLVSIFKTELTKAVSELLYETQKGIFGLKKALNEAGGSDKTRDYMTDISFEYVAEIINRTDFYEVEVIGVGDGLSFNSYLLCGFGTLLFLLMGLSLVPIFAKTDKTFFRVLASRSINAPSQILAEFISYFLMIYAVLAVILLGLSAVPEVSTIFPELARFRGTADVLLILIKLAPFVFVISSYQFLLFGLTSGIASGILMQFLAAVFMGYVTGCIYPISFLPDSISRITSFLPSAAARSYTSSIVSGEVNQDSLLLALAWGIVFLLISIVVRNRKILGLGGKRR